MAGLVTYNKGQCNGNCEKPFWNDTSIDWPSSSQSGLTADYDQCEGWVRWFEWGGLRLIGLTETWGEDDYNCAVYPQDGKVSEELAWGTGGLRLRLIGDWDWLMEPADYRILDCDPRADGRQIPYVGITAVDDAGVYVTIERTGRKLYVDNLYPLASMKIWAYGNVKGDHLDMRDFGVLWWWWWWWWW
jgi:hypothetical protein